MDVEETEPAETVAVRPPRRGRRPVRRVEIEDLDDAGEAEIGRAHV